MLKVKILTCAWKRPEILRVFCIGVKNLQDSYKDRIEVSCLVVTSEQESSDICDEYGIKWLEHENLPLSNKWNAGLLSLKEEDFDYLLILGSDDIMSASLLALYYNEVYMKGLHYAGVLDSYVYDHATETLLYYFGMEGRREGEPVGSGRFIHKSVLNTVEWKLWHDDLNKSLDYSTTVRLHDFELKQQFFKLKDTGCMIVDIKSEVNVTPFNTFIDTSEKVSVQLMDTEFPFIRKNL